MYLRPCSLIKIAPRQVTYQLIKCELIFVILAFQMSIFFSSFRLSFFFSSQGIKSTFCLHIRKKQTMAAVKRLPVHHHNADSTFWPFRIIGLILSQFGNRVPQKPVLGGVGSVPLLHYITWTASIKPSLLFLFLWCVRNFIHHLFYLHCSWCCAVWRP